MTDIIEIATIPAIAALVYTVIDIAKTAVKGNEKFTKFIPVIACVLGAITGAVCFYYIPGVITSENVFSAIVMGAASGLSATGANQAVKQLSKENTTDNTADTDNTTYTDNTNEED